MDLEQARTNMIKQQIRTWNVLDDKVLDLLVQIPRERFVPDAYKALAFADINIPLQHNECMMQPKEEAYILQALKVKPYETVLEVGTGSGYLTALLAKQAKRVITIDIYPDFMRPAAEHISQLSISNVTLTTGNAALGWETDAPYDIIAITGSLPLLPDEFRQQLKVGGRMFVILGKAPAMEATLITRISADEWQTESLFETVIPPLHNAIEPSKFHF